MPEHKYTLHSSEDCTVVITRRSIKDGLGVPMGSRIDPVKKYKKSEKKCKKELKALKKHNKILYRVSKNLTCTMRSKISRRAGKKILRRPETLPVMIWNPIHCYPVT